VRGFAYDYRNILDIHGSDIRRAGRFLGPILVDAMTKIDEIRELLSRIDERSLETAKWRDDTTRELKVLASKSDVEGVVRRVARLEKWVFGVATAAVGSVAAWFKGSTGV
jgi:hypothetical protein